MPPPDWIIIAARDEADRIGATLTALRAAFPHAAVVVADDSSRDATGALAQAHGAQVVRTPRPLGKGGAATLAARRALAQWPPDPAGAGSIALLCDADLGPSAARLTGLVDALSGGDADLAIAAFTRRSGGGFGLALAFARWAVQRRCGLRAGAPISGQRALRRDALAAALPFAPRYGMEVAMTIDVARSGRRVVEVPLDLDHRATGRTVRGFVHRARQLADFALVYARRR